MKIILFQVKKYNNKEECRNMKNMKYKKKINFYHQNQSWNKLINLMNKNFNNDSLIMDDILLSRVMTFGLEK